MATILDNGNMRLDHVCEGCKDLVILHEERSCTRSDSDKKKSMLEHEKALKLKLMSKIEELMMRRGQERNISQVETRFEFFYIYIINYWPYTFPLIISVRIGLNKDLFFYV